MQLVDRLEELVERGRRLPFGGSVTIDREAFLNIVDQMRITIPQEIRRYQEFEAERDRYIAQAQQDARTILEQAHEDAARLLDEQSIKRQAELDAQRLMDRARREAEEVRSGSDAYALASLQQLDLQVQRLARTIQNGLSELTANAQQAAAPAGPAGAAEASKATAAAAPAQAAASEHAEERVPASAKARRVDA